MRILSYIEEKISSGKSPSEEELEELIQNDDAVVIELPPDGTDEYKLAVNITKFLSYMRGKYYTSVMNGPLESAHDSNILIMRQDRSLKFVSVKKLLGQARVALALLLDGKYKFKANEVDVELFELGMEFNLVSYLRTPYAELYEQYREEKELLLLPKNKVYKNLVDTTLTYHDCSQLLSALSDGIENLHDPVTYVQALLGDDMRFRSIQYSKMRIIKRRELKICCASGCLNEPESACGACLVAVYCSEDCQRKAWREEHKALCAGLREERKSAGDPILLASEWKSIISDPVRKENRVEFTSQELSSISAFLVSETYTADQINKLSPIELIRLYYLVTKDDRRPSPLILKVRMVIADDRKISRASGEVKKP